MLAAAEDDGGGATLAVFGFEEDVAAEVGALESSEHVADEVVVGRGIVRRWRAVEETPARVGEQRGERVGERDDDRRLGPQDSVGLAEHAVEVGDGETTVVLIWPEQWQDVAHLTPHLARARSSSRRRASRLLLSSLEGFFFLANLYIIIF